MKTARVGASVTTALVVGGSGALGRAMVSQLQGRGYRVAIHYASRRQDAEALAGAAEACFAVGADIADWDAVRNMVDEVHERFKSSVGVLVNAAGTRGDGLLAGQSPAEWRRVIDVNLLGTFHLCRAVVPQMLRARYGRILNVVSPAGAVGSPGQTAYSASKAGVAGLTRSLAHECGRRGVTANCVSPGLMESAMTAGIPQEVRDAILGRAAVSGLVDPAEVARVLDLVIDAPHLTGQVLSVDGGVAS